jgi:riboflavin synthase
MFTGIISALGRVVDVQALGAGAQHGRRLAIETPAGWLDDVQAGDSIAIDGACMTVTSFERAPVARFTVEVSAESLARTARLAERRDVNLEKALRADDRLGGHLVSGHVDGIGGVVRVTPVGESRELVVRVPRELARFVAYKGSIAIDGVSLTVNRVDDVADGASELSINVIAHTLAHTTLGRLEPGARVNLEIDPIARYVERMLGAR